MPLRCELTPKPRIGAVRGVVVASDGKHVEGARVELTGPSLQNLVSDAQGQFEVAALPAGNYTARVEAEGYLIRLQSFEVVAGAGRHAGDRARRPSRSKRRSC